MNDETEELEADVYSATLMILGDELNPQDVTDQLGIEPSQSWRKGEHKSFTNNDETIRYLDSKHEYSGWKCFLPGEQEHLELSEQLNWWCNFLRGKEAVMLSLEEKGCWLEMNCFATGAVEISADTQIRLSDLSLNLTI
jgi:hypothetical protein